MEIPIDDSALLRKLDIEAGTTNSDILTDLEKKRARALVSDMEGVLSSLDQEIERLVSKRLQVAERLSRFRVALAPHKRVPLEILADIFVHTLNGAPVKFPPHPDDSPWVLERVCSSWRHVTLNEPRLWNNIWVRADNFHEKVTQFISFINNFVHPSWAPLSITLRNELEFASQRDVELLVVPNLWRMKHLGLYISVETFAQLFDVAPEQFSTLESLKLDLWASNYNVGHMDSLDMFGLAIVFQNAHRLRKVDLSDSDSEIILLDAMLRLPLPWSALTCLRLTQLQELTLLDLHRTLRQCASLVDLFARIRYPRNHFIQPIDTTESLELYDLRCVELQDDLLGGASLPDLQLPWDRLTTLFLYDFLNLTLSETHTIIHRCTRIEVLSLTILETSSPSNFPGEPVVLPMLRYLKIDIGGTEILPCFTAPALDTLILNAQSLPIHDVRDMLIRSSCSLSTFSYLGRVCSDLQDMKSLLAFMPSLRSFQVADLCLDDDVMWGIASGELLPRVKVLRCTLQDTRLMSFIHVLEMRREAEVTAGVGGANPADLRRAWDENIASGQVLTEKNVMNALQRIETVNKECGTDFVLGPRWREVVLLWKSTAM